MIEEKAIGNSYYVLYQGDIRKGLENNNIKTYIVLNDLLCLIYTPINFNVKKFDSIPEITYYRKSRVLASLTEITNLKDIGELPAEVSGSKYLQENPYIKSTGKNTLIAIIDSGINYLDSNFINEDNQTKIVRIWDQTNIAGNPPEGFLFGKEITKGEINEAIKNKDESLTTDSIGTGTMLAGICSSNEVDKKIYSGVARDSELIVVKLREYKGTYMEGKINYIEADFLAAVQYVANVSIELNIPIVINMSVGGIPGGYTNTTILTALEMFNSTDIIFVAGAGNEGNTDTHTSGIIKQGETKDIIVEINEEKNIEISISCDSPDKLALAIISPAGEITNTYGYSPDISNHKGKFDLEDVMYEIEIFYPNAIYPSEIATVNLYNLKPGIWTIRLYGEFIVNGTYNISLPNKSLISSKTRFLSTDPLSTINIYGGDDRLITVGAYNSKTDSYWIGSSKGPVRGIFIKPDIVAPGVNILGPYKDTYNTATGTGISSAIVSGVCSLLIEYFEGQGVNAESSYTPVIKTYLMLGAIKKRIYTYPNVSEGYGLLNVKETVRQIAINI